MRKVVKFAGSRDSIQIKALNSKYSSLNPFHFYQWIALMYYIDCKLTKYSQVIKNKTSINFIKIISNNLR